MSALETIYFINSVSKTKLNFKIACEKILRSSVGTA